ncbi:uncharacterized protein FMAN_07342 [Fusarium mangiferae]|uniref:Nucleoside phosphorylase domain-containing protein n=1 Tax=Fusarium mangiferae TaxID=192010 RepID=A0A1L7TCB7_FUSMA|nr:uncharacterized protein FMAN_07342 [Fusarium mangiferae]CVK92446.1 uncharacterized protein FMAN_07342 [Fusarium mangiferae]
MKDQTLLNVPRNEYSVGWICALPVELAAAKSMLDALHETFDQHIHDSNTYIFGSIGPHNIALACLPYKGTGTSNAAIAATHLRRSFPSITLMLMVGIGGGIPGPHNPRLGDVVVGSEVIQYDLGKSFDDHFQRKGTNQRPHSNARTALSRFKAGHDAHQNNIPNILRQLDQYAAPDPTLDVLFCNRCEPLSTNDCEFCDELNHVQRASRSTEPRIHYGKIASGNRVVRNATERDEIAQEPDVLCIDMEAAGVMDSYPCLSIRGLSDYADAHKNDVWQEYAACTAAACAKEFLSIMPRRKIPESASASNTSQSSSHEQQRRAPSGQRTTHKVTAHGMTVGDNARQLVLCGAGGEVDASYLTAGDNCWQVIGSEALMSSICNSQQPQNIRYLDDGDSKTQLMDECVSGPGRQ